MLPRVGLVSRYGSKSACGQEDVPQSALLFHTSMYSWPSASFVAAN